MINLNATMNHAGDKDPIWNISVQRGEIVECMTPEGRSDDFVCLIYLENWYTGSRYVLKTPFYGYIESGYDEECGSWDVYVNAFTRASNFLEKIKARGTVDLNHWKQLKDDE